MAFLCISQIARSEKSTRSRIRHSGNRRWGGWEIGYSWIFNRDYGSSFGKTFAEVKRLSRRRRRSVLGGRPGSRR